MRPNVTFGAKTTTTLLTLSLGLAACKSSDDAGDGDKGATSTAVVGIISGFGSVIVNGVRFDDDGATISDDDGSTTDSTNLGLGMTVDVRGSASDDGSGVATSIGVFSELQGPVADLDATAGTFSLLGQVVAISADTVFDDFSGLAALANGTLVEVYGLRSDTGVRASRIERKTPAVGQPVAKLRGIVSGLDDTAKTFKIGTVTVNYTNAMVAPDATTLANDALVKVVATEMPVGVDIAASKITIAGSSRHAFGDVGRIELQGVVSGFTSVADFSIDGIKIDASNAVYLRGSANDVANGKLLEIKGALSEGVLRATRVKFEDGSGSGSFELHGNVSNFMGLASFVVRGVTVDASGASVVFERGVAGDVANGVNLEVEGSMAPSDSGSKLVATFIKFESESGRDHGGSDDGSADDSADDSSDDSSDDSGTDDSGRDDNPSASFEFTGEVTNVSGDQLVVGGYRVQLTSTTLYRKISKDQIVVGALVSVKGSRAGSGLVTATRVSLED